MNLTNNTILITGGGSGIGRGLAEQFQKLGNRVIIAGRRQSVLDETVAANPGMMSMILDVEDPAKIQAFVTKITTEHPDLNVLINNAGIMRNENLLADKIDVAVSEDTISTNLLAPIRLIAGLLPHLRTQPQATIINVSSGLAFVPLAMTPTYSATKAAIHSYTQSLRYQLKDTSVEVIELVPPYVQTELMGKRQASDPSAMPLSEFISEVMTLLKAEPATNEITVERVKPQRFAESSGQHDAFFTNMNDALKAARGSEIS